MSLVGKHVKHGVRHNLGAGAHLCVTHSYLGICGVEQFCRITVSVESSNTTHAAPARRQKINKSTIATIKKDQVSLSERIK